MTRLACILGGGLLALSVPTFSLADTVEPIGALPADCFQPLQNPSFEATLVPNQSEYNQIPNWTLTSGMRTVVYGSPGSLSSAPASPDDWGSTYLDGGFSDLAIATQRIEVPTECESIYDEGYYFLLLEARLGDVVGEPDHAEAEVRFLNAADQQLGDLLQTGFIPPGTGNSISSILVCSKSLLPGTRFVEIRVLLVNTNGGRNTAWADNFSIGFAWPDPVEPTSWGAIKARFLAE